MKDINQINESLGKALDEATAVRPTRKFIRFITRTEMDYIIRVRIGAEEGIDPMNLELDFRDGGVDVFRDKQDDAVYLGDAKVELGDTEFSFQGVSIKPTEPSTWLDRAKDCRDSC